MSGYSCSVIDDLDQIGRETNIDFEADESVGHTVRMPLDFDMVVYADEGFLPLSQLIRRMRLRTQQGLIESLEG
jgi:hypothetical protein